MISAYDMTLLLYNLALLPVVFLSVIFIFLAMLNLMIRSPETKSSKKISRLPFVTVHIPTFNDPIAARCVERCLHFDYPKDKYEVIVVDDSTNLKTQAMLKRFADDNPGFVKYIHRTNREGFKPGALNNAMSITKGEIITVFDSDWMPKKDYLKTIVQPFADPDVAIVQSRQDFYNKDVNVITRFASYILMVFHTIMMPINNRINTVFFCGTAGALRRSAFEEAGGWNSHSVTEDAELSVRLMMNGYKTVYLDYSTKSEVPDTFESFIKQQMRWCYGNVRVFLDNYEDILSSKNLKLRQKFMILFQTMGHVVAPFVLLMTFFGLSGWFVGDPRLFMWSDLVEFFSRFAYTAGFFLMGGITLWKRNFIKEFPYFIYTAFTMGLVISVANSTAFFKAITNKKLHWFCTPKIDNRKVM